MRSGRKSTEENAAGELVDTFVGLRGNLEALEIPSLHRRMVTESHPRCHLLQG